MEFKFDRFNPRRAMRGVEAASLVVDDPSDPDGPCMLWMSKADVGRNMIAFGRQPALVEAWEAYAAYETPNEELGVMNAAQVQERKQTLLAEEHGNQPTLWWMSFCDPDKPKGQQFLGVAIVEATGFMHAHQRAWALGINPGGEIQAFQVEGVPVDYHDMLLSRAELEAAGLV